MSHGTYPYPLRLLFASQVYWIKRAPQCPRPVYVRWDGPMSVRGRGRGLSIPFVRPSGALSEDQGRAPGGYGAQMDG